MLNFVRNCQTVFQSGHTNLFPPAVDEYSYCSISSPISCVVSVLGFCHSDRCVLESDYSFNFQFPMTNDAENLFLCLFAVCISSLVRCLPIFNWVVCFLLLCLKSSLYILDNSPLSDMSSANIFFPLCGLSSYALDRIFLIAEVYILMKPSL